MPSEMCLFPNPIQTLQTLKAGEDFQKIGKNRPKNRPKNDCGIESASEAGMNLSL